MVRKVRLLSSAAALLLMGVVLLVVYANRRTSATGYSAEVTKESTPASTEAALLPTDSTMPPTTEYPIPSYPAVELEVETIVPEEADLRIEAEDAEYTGSLTVEDIRPGYSGDGYLAGFSQTPGDSVKAVFDVPVSQHYSITISVSADKEVTNRLMLNEEPVRSFTVPEGDNFTKITFSGIYIPAGKATLSIEEEDGFFALDYFELSDYTEMYEMDYKDSYPLSDPSASDGAEKLMNYLSSQYGTKIISGQYCAGDADSEIDLIYRLTGRQPAIRFGDVEGYSGNSLANNGDVIGACQRWAEQGGIVGLMWHWDAPVGVSSVYAAETDFSLADALPPYTVYQELVEPDTTEPVETETEAPTEYTSYIEIPTETEAPEFVERFAFSVDVALMTQEEIDKNLESGTISEECAAILRDIDSIAEAMKPLAEKDIPVLWRPLHEASGDWFWWGASGAEAYRWLWDVMYRRMTEYHGLHNLIWIWNGQSEDYLVDNYDIAALDAYPENVPFGSRYEQFVRLSRMTGGEKMLALSETSSVPDLKLMFRDNTIWSFFGLWYGEYIVDDDGMYSERYTTADDMIAFYNSNAVVTLDDTKKELAG